MLFMRHYNFSKLDLHHFLFQIYFWQYWVSVAGWTFSSCDERGLLSNCALGLLFAVASLGHSRCVGLPRCMWDLSSLTRD